MFNGIDMGLSLSVKGFFQGPKVESNSDAKEDREPKKCQPKYLPLEDSHSFGAQGIMEPS
jgi:hypothetical protein